MLLPRPARQSELEKIEPGWHCVLMELGEHSPRVRRGYAQLKRKI